MSNKKKKKIVIIGAGAGGLASGALLAKAGFDVTILEKNEQAGGRASLLEEDGFRFDMGPSWYLMPDVFERFFAEFGKKPTDFFKLHKLDPQYRIFFGDGTHHDIVRDLEKNKAFFEKIEPGAAQKFEEYLAEGKLKYEVAVQQFLYKNMDSVLDMLQPEILKHAHKLHLWQNMHQYVQKYFKSTKLQQILEYTLVFLGGAPSNTPALFSLMAHVDFNLGVFYPEGGFYAVIEAMRSLAEEHGVVIKYNEPVESIITEADLVTAVRTSKATYSTDAVVANADYAHVEDLLDDERLRMHSKESWEHKTLAPSAFLLYLGVKGKLPKLKHHTLYFGENWQQHFEDIFDKPQWPQQPSIYINKPSATDKTVAPKGHENVMVLVPIAARLKETPRWREMYADYILDYLEDTMKMKLKDKIVYKKIFSVSDFAERYNSLGGNALGGLAHTLFQSAVWRPNNVSRLVPNLFFAGANTVPGIGVPPAIISGHLAEERVNNFFS